MMRPLIAFVLSLAASGVGYAQDGVEPGWLITAAAVASYHPNLTDYQNGFGMDMKGAELRIERVGASVIGLHAEIAHRTLGIACIGDCPPSNKGMELLIGPQLRFRLPHNFSVFAGGAGGYNFGVERMTLKGSVGLDLLTPIGFRIEAGAGNGWQFHLGAGVNVWIP